MANNNKIVVPEARAALNQMKLEIANELGISTITLANLFSSSFLSKRNLPLW